MVYDLYLESGPQKKTTYVHVFDPLGCTWMAPTTEAALAAAPSEIRAYLRFLAALGEDVDTAGQVEVRVAEHQILRGAFLSIAPYPVDLLPCTAEASDRDRRRFAAMVAATLALVEGFTRAELDAVPGRGRPLSGILGHVLGAAHSYVAYLKVPGVNAMRTAVEAGTIDAREALKEGAARIDERLARLTAEELAEAESRGASVRGATRMFRRLLEHSWEHYSELAARLRVER